MAVLADGSCYLEKNENFRFIRDPLGRLRETSDRYQWFETSLDSKHRLGFQDVGVGGVAS